MKRVNSESTETPVVKVKPGVPKRVIGERDHAIMMKIADLEFELDIHRCRIERESVTNAEMLISFEDPVASLFYHVKHTLEWTNIVDDFKFLFFMTYYVLQRLEYVKSGYGPSMLDLKCSEPRLYDKYKNTTLRRMVMEVHNILERMQNAEFDITIGPGEKRETIRACLERLCVVCIAAQLVV